MAGIINNCFWRCVDLMSSALVSAGTEWSGIEPWPRALCWIFGNDTLKKGSLRKPRRQWQNNDSAHAL